MSKRILLISLLIFVMALMGCAGAKPKPTKEAKKVEEPKELIFAKYENVVLRNFQVPEESPAPQSAGEQVSSYAVSFLKHYNQKVSIFKRISKKKEGMVGPTLIVKGRVTEYDPGSQAKQYWLGFGAGRASFAVHCKFIDAQTEKVIEEVDLRSIAGVAGVSTVEEAIYRVGGHIAKYIYRGKIRKE